MKHALVFSLAILAAVLPALAASGAPGVPGATTYYVRSDGDDRGSGLSDKAAWKTIAQVNKSAFAAGDKILFQRGGVWRETLVPPADGLTISAYPRGAGGGGGGRSAGDRRPRTGDRAGGERQSN